MNRILLCSFLRRLIVSASLLGIALCSQAVTFNVTPSSTSNTYSGAITLQINGLSAGETVVIRKYLDLNANGVVEPSDYFVQQCQIQDGQAPTLIGGATNINIPYDHSGTDGAITTTISMSTFGLIHRFAAQYLFVISSPSNHFAAITNSFVVTNSPTGQTITGTVYSNSVPVPYAAVLVGTASQSGDFNPTVGAVANSSGVYTVNVQPDTYMSLALQNNSVGIPAGPIDVTGGATVTNDVTVVAATATISGQVVDAANASVPLVGLLMTAEGNGLATSVTDPTGNFTLAATTGSQWKISEDDAGFSFLGYVSSNNHPKINVTGSVSGLQLSFPKGNALFYGRVVDGNNQPLAGVRLFGQNDYGSGPFQGSATSDANGQYAMAIIDGNWDVEVDQGSLGPEFRGYMFSQSSFGLSNGGTNVAPNTAVHQDFVALLATNTISGYLRDGNSNAISGVQVSANATINGIGFSAQATTDSSGFYSMNVGNGSWYVYVNCCDQCGNGLPAGYQCPNSQNVTIANNNQTLNFTAVRYTTFVSGRVSDEFGNAISNINIFAFSTSGGGGFGATTDNGGMYTIALASGGGYTVQLDTDPTFGAPSLGLVSPSVPVTISDNTTVSNLNLVAQHINGTIIVAITNGDNSQPVSGVYASANCTINGTNYSSGTQTTAADGTTTLGVCSGTWSVGVDCFGLSQQNLNCAPNQNVTVSNGSVPVTFIVHSAGTATPPVLSGASHPAPGQFQFHLNGTPGQNYTVQYATALTNWSFLMTTNPTSPDVIIRDNNAISPTRVYRVLLGP